MQSRGGASRTLTLDGLRGIAVLAVVLEHAWPDLLPGGFAGVDVFFVLSGFLITRILVAELESTGRVNLWVFYARRVRRILPASLITIVVTCLLYVVILGPALSSAMRDEALAATLSVSNILFAYRSVDYFAANPASSPFLHFWSLAVEEQFYLVWPTLLVVIAWVARRATGRVREWLPIAVLVVLGAGSLFLAVRGSEVNAFFLLPHRGWELITGGLLAWLGYRGRLVLGPGRRGVRVAGVLAGWAMLVVTFAAAPELGRWPGLATLLPVGGTALLVLAGDGMPFARILTTAPLQFLGRISYALYLWHWPLLAAAALLALPLAGAWWVALLAVLVAVAVSTASTLLVEEPIRGSRAAVLVGRRAVFWGLASLAVVSVACATLLTVAPPAMAGPGIGEALAASRTDRERIITDGCVTTMRSSTVKDCTYGAASAADGSPAREASPAPPVVVLFGDSHAMHWFPAVNAWAVEHRYDLVPITRSACPPVEAPLVAIERQMTRACASWRTKALARIEALHPALTIVSGSLGTGVVLDGREVRPRYDGLDGWPAAAATMLTAIRDRSAATLFLGDVPRPGFNVPDCLAAHRWSPGSCSLPVDTVSPSAVRAAQAAAATLAGVPFTDPTDVLCPDGTCTWMAADRVGWVDDQHLTASGALHALPSLQAAFDDAMTAGTSAAP